MPEFDLAIIREIQGALVEVKPLIDVGNGFLYASVTAEGEGNIVRPTFIVEDKPAVEKAKQHALTNFGPELLKRMRAVRATTGGTSREFRSISERSCSRVTPSRAAA